MLQKWFRVENEELGIVTWVNTDHISSIEYTKDGGDYEITYGEMNMLLDKANGDALMELLRRRQLPVWKTETGCSP